MKRTHAVSCTAVNDDSHGRLLGGLNVYRVGLTAGFPSLVVLHLCSTRKLESVGTGPLLVCISPAQIEPAVVVHEPQIALLSAFFAALMCFVCLQQPLC